MSTDQTTPRTYNISAHPQNAKRMTVLILDDNVKLTATLKETLEDQGYRTTIVPSGTEGILEVLKNDFDAIVCDMVMPNFPGDMFYSAVRQSRPHLCQRFIFITGHQSNPKIAQFILETGCPALWKPFETRQLFEALETVTGRST